MSPKYTLANVRNAIASLAECILGIREYYEGFENCGRFSENEAISFLDKLDIVAELYTEVPERNMKLWDDINKNPENYSSDFWEGLVEWSVDFYDKYSRTPLGTIVEDNWSGDFIYKDWISVSELRKRINNVRKEKSSSTSRRKPPRLVPDEMREKHAEMYKQCTMREAKENASGIVDSNKTIPLSPSHAPLSGYSDGNSDGHGGGMGGR